MWGDRGEHHFGFLPPCDPSSGPLGESDFGKVSYSCCKPKTWRQWSTLTPDSSPDCCSWGKLVVYLKIWFKKENLSLKNQIEAMCSPLPPLAKQVVVVETFLTRNTGWLTSRATWGRNKRTDLFIFFRKKFKIYLEIFPLLETFLWGEKSSENMPVCHFRLI